MKVETRSESRVIFKTKNGRIRSANLKDLCEAFLKFYESLDKTEPSSFIFIPMLKNYEKATWALVDRKPDVVQSLLKVDFEPEKEFEVDFLRDGSLSIKFPKVAT